MLDSDIVAALERAGVEIEQYSSSKPVDKNIVAALVKNVIQHPGADRLKIATVYDGREELVIVCGAPNVREGLLTPLARVGALLPDGTAIAEAKLRGEVSHGMLCSSRELGLGPDHDGLLELPDTTEPGTLLCDLYPADGFVDVKTPANRFDLLGAIGLAREIAAMTDTPLPLPPTHELVGVTKPELVGKIGEGSRRFVVAELEVTGNGHSPDWLVARLAVAGMRSLGLLVDITNYVMLETAQPLHAYDAARVHLPLGVAVAADGDVVQTLDGAKRSLVAGDLVVTDADGIVGLAGVRGGAATEITASTKHIYLEAATFDGALIRRAAKRHNLRTDASARFERGLAPEAAWLAVERAVYLLEQLGGAKLIGWAEVSKSEPAPRRVTLSAAHASRILGIRITPAKLAATLSRLEIEAKNTSKDVIVVPPWWRPDIKEPEDLIEEAVRVIGYDVIPSTLPVWRPRVMQFDYTRPQLSKIRTVLSGAGLFEVMTYSFVSAQQLADVGLSPEQHLKLRNPLSIEQAYLRTMLLSSHLAVASRNRMYAKAMSFYELSNVFLPRQAGEQPDEPMQLGIMTVRPDNSYRHLKGLLDDLCQALNVVCELEPATIDGPWAKTRSARIKLGEIAIGTIGQLDPGLVTSHKLDGEASYLELAVGPLLAASVPVQAAARSRFPGVRRDLTVIVADTVMWQAVAETLAEVPDVRVSFGSDYVGGNIPAGHKSLSLRMAITYTDHTPTDAEAADLEAKVRSILRRSFAAS